MKKSKSGRRLRMRNSGCARETSAAGARLDMRQDGDRAARAAEAAGAALLHRDAGGGAARRARHATSHAAGVHTRRRGNAPERRCNDARGPPLQRRFGLRVRRRHGLVALHAQQQHRQLLLAEVGGLVAARGLAIMAEASDHSALAWRRGGAHAPRLASGSMKYTVRCAAALGPAFSGGGFSSSCRAKAPKKRTKARSGAGARQGMTPRARDAGWLWAA